MSMPAANTLEKAPTSSSLSLSRCLMRGNAGWVSQKLISDSDAATYKTAIDASGVCLAASCSGRFEEVGEVEGLLRSCPS